MNVGIWGMLIVLAASLALYLASPNQLLVKRALPGKILGWSGLGALLLGLCLLLQWAGPATAVFVAFTLAMIVWTLIPLAAAWLRRPGEGAK